MRRYRYNTKSHEYRSGQEDGYGQRLSYSAIVANIAAARRRGDDDREAYWRGRLSETER